MLKQAGPQPDPRGNRVRAISVLPTTVAGAYPAFGLRFE